MEAMYDAFCKLARAAAPQGSYPQVCLILCLYTSACSASNQAAPAGLPVRQRCWEEGSGRTI